MSRSALFGGAAVVTLLLVADFVDDGVDALTIAATTGAILLSCWSAGSIIGWLLARFELRQGRAFWFTGLLRLLEERWLAARSAD